jgi:anti-sigma factor RsiW
MRDMTRDEMQDLLPDLLHGRLSEYEAVAIQRALASDPGLASELAMLRAVQTSQRNTPTIDIARIVAALPSPPTVVPAAPIVDDLSARRAAKRPMISTRFARAAALLVVVGGGSLVSVWRGQAPTATGLAANVSASVSAESLASQSVGMQLGLGAATDELSVEQLRALEDDIRSLDGVPSAEVEAGTDYLAGEGA